MIVILYLHRPFCQPKIVCFAPKSFILPQKSFVLPTPGPYTAFSISFVLPKKSSVLPSVNYDGFYDWNPSIESLNERETHKQSRDCSFCPKTWLQNKRSRATWTDDAWHLYRITITRIFERFALRSAQKSCVLPQNRAFCFRKSCVLPPPLRVCSASPPVWCGIWTHSASLRCAPFRSVAPDPAPGWLRILSVPEQNVQFLGKTLDFWSSAQQNVRKFSRIDSTSEFHK